MSEKQLGPYNVDWETVAGELEQIAVDLLSTGLHETDYLKAKWIIKKSLEDRLLTKIINGEVNGKIKTKKERQPT